jgi:undecaprenyl-diphosphatase
VERFLDAVLLGLVQGLTEFLPISSSGHLVLFQEWLGWKDPSQNLAFNIAVHVGSLGAVLVFVWREIKASLTTQPRLLLVLVITVVPLIVAALLGAKDLLEGLAGNLALVGCFLLGTSAILVVAQRLPGGKGTIERIPYGRAFLVALAQVLAILPGISRSGSTLTAGLGVGLEREEAVRFAFLMAAPAIAGAAMLMVLEGGGTGSLPVGPLAAGVVVSFLASLVAMKLMVGVVVKRRLGWFALYCAAIGIFAITLALT